MIQNLREVFSHTDIVLLTGIFIIILYLIFPIKKINKVILFRIIAACCLWWLLLVYIYPPKGFNYNIYTYNASLTIYGQEAYNRDDIPVSKKNGESFSDPKCLDYTGAQHLLYVFLEYIDLYKINSNLSAFGFRLWMLLNISLILLLIFYLYDNVADEVDANNVWPILFVSFCPIIPFYILITKWEDKLIFLLIPLLVLFLLHNKKYQITSFLLGFIIAFNGLSIFFLPIYLIFLHREVKKYLFINYLMVLLGVIIAMIPFFPESLSAWSNRFNRTSASAPFWFSFYSFLPDGLYTPQLNSLMIILVCIFSILLYIFRRINLIDALIISVSVVILLSPYNVVSRVIPLIMLVSILTPNSTKYNWISLSFVLSIYILVDNGYIVPIINTGNTILFYVPILYSFTIYIYQRVKFGHSIILSS